MSCNVGINRCSTQRHYATCQNGIGSAVAEAQLGTICIALDKNC